MLYGRRVLYDKQANGRPGAARVVLAPTPVGDGGLPERAQMNEDSNSRVADVHKSVRAQMNEVVFAALMHYGVASRLPLVRRARCFSRSYLCLSASCSA